jgi:inositol phosphorylceramide mannosyltransferase catalytic subunit
MIPNVVHRLWLGPHKMPKPYQNYGDSWRDHGYIVYDWTDANWCLPIINQDVWDRIAGGVNVGGGDPRTGVYVQRADLLSYEIVWRFGGIYANTDIECRKPLPLDDVEAFACWEVPEDFVGNAIFGGVKGHPFWRAVIDRLPGRYDQFANHPMNEQTGPHLLSEVHKSTPGLTVKPRWWCYPYGFGDMHLEGKPELWGTDSYCEHHWGHQHPELLEA